MFLKSSFLFFALILTPILSAKEQAFFARQVHPLEISADGSRLFALDSAQARLLIYATGAAPLLIREIPVGLLPVSVRRRTSDEIWVVNELSDSISIVSLADNTVVASLSTGDEPGDVAFIDDLAFVTCSRDNRIDVFDVETRVKTAEIPLEGLFPRSLVVSPDQSTLAVSFFYTSNGTTILPRQVAPPQEVPDWASPDLPPPPQTARIVPVDHPEISYEVVDHDLALIAADDYLDITYLGNIGTNLFSLNQLPDGRLLAPNSEARNLIRFEPQLRGRFSQSRLALVADGSIAQQIDLNPDPDLLFPVIDSEAATSALAQVMTTVVEPDGNHVWLAAFGSDRLVRLNLETLERSTLLDLRSPDGSSPRTGQTVRGPRGLALHPTLPHLYVLNQLSHTLSTIDRKNGTVIAETPLGTVPDLADDLKLGRGFLFDARLSGNGSVSCTSCHIDLERDGMAWNLGDPSGEILTVPGALLSVHEPNLFQDREMHPMKGPMVTQTLIGLVEQTKLHWRGDKPSIQSFNSTFPKLLAAEALAAEEMDLVAAYLETLRHHPNPNLKLDRNLPGELHGGDPLAGIAVYTLFDNHCAACHHLPSGSSNNIDLPSTVGSFQPLKDTPFRTLYHRHHLNPVPGARSLAGFGLGSDGSLHDLPIGHPYSLHLLDDISRPLAARQKDKRDLTAFLLSFDSGTAPAIGHSVTFHSSDREDPSKNARLIILEEQASLGEFSETGVVAHGILDREGRSFHFDPITSRYQSDRENEIPLTALELLEALGPDDSLTFMGVPVLSAITLSTDRNANGIPDLSEPVPVLEVLPDRQLRWLLTSPFFHPEFSSDLDTWNPLTTPAIRDGSMVNQQLPAQSQAFFRLRPVR